MNIKDIYNFVISYILGLLLGIFLSLTILREALPLKSHIYMISIASISLIPTFIALFLWYLHILKGLKKKLGQKGGELIGTLLTFIIVTNILIFVIVSAIFFAAIA